MKIPAFFRSKVFLWVLVGLVSFLFLERIAREVLYYQALYRSYKLSASYYRLPSGFLEFKRQYEETQKKTLLQFDPIVTDQFNRRYYHPSVTGHYYGFRQTAPKKSPTPGVVRILCMGSSTVEMGFPSELQRVLDENLPGRYEVINAGIPGISTLSILMDFISLWSSLGAHVVVLENNVDSVTANALRPYYLETTARELNERDELQQMADAFRPRLGLNLINLVRWNLKYNLNRVERKDQPYPEGVERFREWTAAIVRIAISYGASPVLVTYQPSLSLARKDLGGYSESFLTMAMSYYNAIFFTHTIEGALRTLATHNEVTRELSRSLGVPLVEVEGLVPRKDDSYVDGTHYSDSANRLIAEAVAHEVLSLPNPLLPRGIAEHEFEVVVVGAGVAGLSAAAHLEDQNVLILEKEPRIGGRVFTGHGGGPVFELGASHSWSDGNDFGDISEDSDVVRIEGPMGLYFRGSIVWCERPIECVRALPVEPEIISQVESCQPGGQGTPEVLHPEALEILNALYMAEHPDDIRTADMKVRHRAFEPIEAVFNRGGNERLLTALIRKAHPETRLASEVTSVESTPRGVRVTYLSRGQQRMVTARRAVLAVPAPVVRRIARGTSRELDGQLAAVEYHPVVVAVIGFKGVHLPRSFSQVITAGQDSTMILNNLSVNPNEPVLRVYFGASSYGQLSSLTDEEVLKKAGDIIRTTGLLQFSDDQVLFQKLRRWDLGTVRKSAPLPPGSPRTLSLPGNHIFLAGDYLCPMGSVGMDCAFSSGKAAAMALRDSILADVIQGSAAKEPAGP